MTPSGAQDGHRRDGGLSQVSTDAVVKPRLTPTQTRSARRAGALGVTLVIVGLSVLVIGTFLGLLVWALSDNDGLDAAATDGRGSGERAVGVLVATVIPAVAGIGLIGSGLSMGIRVLRRAGHSRPGAIMAGSVVVSFLGILALFGAGGSLVGLSVGALGLTFVLSMGGGNPIYFAISAAVLAASALLGAVSAWCTAHVLRRAQSGAGVVRT